MLQFPGSIVHPDFQQLFRLGESVVFLQAAVDPTILEQAMGHAFRAR